MLPADVLIPPLSQDKLLLEQSRFVAAAQQQPMGGTAAFITTVDGGDAATHQAQQLVEVLQRQLADVKRSRDEEVALLHTMMKESRRIFSQAMKARRA